MTIEFLTESNVRLVEALASDPDVCQAAWVSNDLDSEERLDNPDRVEGLIKYLMREKHMSPFGHSFLKFEIETPIFVTREFRTHTVHWSYSPLVIQRNIGQVHNPQTTLLPAGTRTAFHTAWEGRSIHFHRRQPRTI